MKLFALLLLCVFQMFGQAQTKSFTPTNAIGTERHFALVIGNKDYTSIGSLKNPINERDVVIAKGFNQRITQVVV